MKMNRVIVQVVTSIEMEIGEDVNIDETIAEMDYNFEPKTDNVVFTKTLIRDYKITFNSGDLWIERKLNGTC